MKVENKDGKGNPYHDDAGRFTSGDLDSSKAYTDAGGVAEKTQRYLDAIEKNGFDKAILSGYNNKWRRYYIDDNLSIPYLLSKKTGPILDQLGQRELFENHLDRLDKLGIDLVCYDENLTVPESDVIDVKTSEHSFALRLTNVAKDKDGVFHMYKGWLIDDDAVELSGGNKSFLFNRIETGLSEIDKARAIKEYKDKYGPDWMEAFENDFIRDSEAFLFTSYDLEQYLFKKNSLTRDELNNIYDNFSGIFDETGKTLGNVSGQDFAGLLRKLGFRFSNGTFTKKLQNGLLQKISFDSSLPFWDLNVSIVVPEDKIKREWNEYKL